MDPLTHGLIGSATSQSIVKKEKFYPAAFTGFVAALLADLDIFIHDSTNPLLNIELHRQFTHSLIFIPIGALVASGLVYWFVRKKLNFKEIYLFSFLAYATSSITDTFTSYGTKLLWPFVDERYAWNVISVFDPVFSAGIIIFLALALYKKERIYAWLAFGWIFIYLLGGFSQLTKATNMADDIASSRGHTIEYKVVKPTIGNQIIWSVRYIAGDTLYADAVRLSRISGRKIYEGESTEILNWRDEFSGFTGTTLYDDIKRFSVLSDDVLILKTTETELYCGEPAFVSCFIIGDGRYAMLPTSVDPLWGIIVDTTQPDKHVPFENFRDGGREVRDAFWEMITGK